MKTKNRGDRSGAVPAGASSSPNKTVAAAPRGAGAASRGPPRLELEGGRKWVVENQVPLSLEADRALQLYCHARATVETLLLLPVQVDNREVVVEVTDVKQTVYIYGCQGSTIQARCPMSDSTLRFLLAHPSALSKLCMAVCCVTGFGHQFNLCDKTYARCRSRAS
jgi:hypothetical protein